MEDNLKLIYQCYDDFELKKITAFLNKEDIFPLERLDAQTHYKGGTSYTTGLYVDIDEVYYAKRAIEKFNAASKESVDGAAREFKVSLLRSILATVAMAVVLFIWHGPNPDFPWISLLPFWFAMLYLFSRKPKKTQ